MSSQVSSLDILKQHPRQMSFALVLHLLSVTCGVGIGSTSVILHKLLDEGILNEEEGSWFASIFLPGLITGCIVAGILSSWLGPKTTSTITALAFMVGLLTISMGHNLTMLCIGRFVLGMAMTCARGATQPFICEYSHPGLRGLLGSMFFTFYCMGYAAFIPLGHIMSWRVALLLAMILPSTTFFCSLFMHESPTWLLARGLDEKADQSLRFYERPLDEIPAEIQSIKKCLEKQLLAKEECKNMTFKQHVQEFTEDFLQASFLKPMFYVSVSLSCIEWSSFPVLAYYLVIIFEETGSTMDPYLASTIAALSRIIWALIGSALMFRFPRRTLFLASSPFLLLSLCGLATFCLFTQDDSDLAHMLATDFNFLSLILIMSTHFFFAIGYGSTTLVLPGEIFPAHLSSVGASCANLVEYAASFLAVTLAAPMKDALGLSGLFYFYSGVIMLMFAFGAYLMPETKGLTLREIQEKYYQPKKKKEEKVAINTKDIAPKMVTKL